jgi:hypothetical protein
VGAGDLAVVDGAGWVAAGWSFGTIRIPHPLPHKRRRTIWIALHPKNAITSSLDGGGGRAGGVISRSGLATDDFTVFIRYRRKGCCCRCYFKHSHLWALTIPASPQMLNMLLTIAMYWWRMVV